MAAVTEAPITRSPTPGETELAYAFQYQSANEGPLIVWPEGYPEGGYWAHIGAVKTEDML